jgi:hypothetical protein
MENVEIQNELSDNENVNKRKFNLKKSENTDYHHHIYDHNLITSTHVVMELGINLTCYLVEMGGLGNTFFKYWITSNASNILPSCRKYKEVFTPENIAQIEPLFLYYSDCHLTTPLEQFHTAFQLQVCTFLLFFFFFCFF